AAPAGHQRLLVARRARRQRSAPLRFPRVVVRILVGRMRMRSWVILGALAIASGAQAAPCRDNYWQPTYVHDLTRPDGQPWYVMPDGRFVPVAVPYEVNGAQLCERYGVRDPRGFTNCRDYTRVQCGCDGASGGNATCRAFLAMRAQYAPPPAPPPPQQPQPQQYLPPPVVAPPPPPAPPPHQRGLGDAVDVPSDSG